MPRPWAGAGGGEPAGPLRALTSAGTDSESSHSCTPPRASKELPAVPRAAFEIGTEASGAVVEAGDAAQAKQEGSLSLPWVGRARLQMYQLDSPLLGIHLKAGTAGGKYWKITALTFIQSTQN